MALFANSVPNLADWAAMASPDGTIGYIVNLMAQCNNVVEDAIAKPGNLPMGHECSVVNGLPQPSWKANNQGIAATKPLFGKVKFSIGILRDYGMVDKDEAELNGEVAQFRLQQAKTHIQGMAQKVANSIFYANESTLPSSTTGLTLYYNALSTTAAATAANVINAGGTGSSNASLWLTGWSDEGGTSLLFPKGSAAGLVHEDKGDIVPLYDVNGLRYEGFTDVFTWKLGVGVDNWQFNVRIGNIDTTTAAGGLLSTTPPDIFALMSAAINLVPHTTPRASGIVKTDDPNGNIGHKFAWYSNRTVKTAMEIQAIRNKNVLMSPTEFDGAPVLNWRGIPIRLNDTMTNAETVIS